MTAHQKLTMFRIEQHPDGSATLTLHGVEDGQHHRDTYGLDLWTAVAFRGAVLRDLTIAGTPQAQEQAAEQARAFLADVLAGRREARDV